MRLEHGIPCINWIKIRHWRGGQGSLVQVLDINLDVGLCYGRIRAALTTSGNLIGPNDLWIAAHALSLGVPLISHNLREFRRVQGLQVETWMHTG